MRLKLVRRSVAIVMALGMTTAMSALPAHAKQVEAKSLQYKNNGAYSADFLVEYRREFEGDTVLCRVGKNTNDLVTSGKSRTIDLTSSNLALDKGSKKQCFTDSGTIPLGTEVWGYIKIIQGENQKCRKDTRIIVSRSGGEVKYRTGGTTYNNNRCKVSSWP